MVVRAQAGTIEGHGSRSPDLPPIWQHKQQQRLDSSDSTDCRFEFHGNWNLPEPYAYQERASKNHGRIRPSGTSHHHPESPAVPALRVDQISLDPYSTSADGRHDRRLDTQPHSITTAQGSIGGSNATPLTMQASEQSVRGEAVSSGSRIPAGTVRCLNCDKRETPEWRKGPYGPRTLCNACVSANSPLYSLMGLTWVDWVVAPLSGSSMGKDTEKKSQRCSGHRQTAVTTACKQPTVMAARGYD